MLKTDLLNYLAEVENELRGNILPFWMDKVTDLEHDGFYGWVANDLQIDKTAPKGCILNSRIMWTYAAAYKRWGDRRYLETARRALDFMLKYFWDHDFGGLHWMVDYQGNPVDTRKQIYNLAFGIYGLSELYAAGGEEVCLEKAMALYQMIEIHSYDHENLGYIEATTREWLPIDDLRLSVKDLNEKKSMNTHLHILEAYTNLLRVHPNDNLQESLADLIAVIMKRIVDNETFHFKLFFDEKWNSKSDLESHGHDIEGSWLLYEAALVLGDQGILYQVRNLTLKMVEKVYQDGIDTENGGIFSETKNGMVLDENKDWWPQAEAMVGFLNAYELSGREDYLVASYDIWRFIKRCFIDQENGEWFWKVSHDGRADLTQPKVDPWKCPYHNSRACFEVASRLKNIIQIEGC